MTRRVPWRKVLPLVLVAGLAANWVWEQRSSRLEQAAAVEAEADALEAQLPAARAAAARADELKRQLGVASAALPDSADLPGLITTLNATAVSSGVQWRTSRFGTPTMPAAGRPASEGATTTTTAKAAGADTAPAAAPLGTVTVDVEVAATERTLQTYLDALARLPRLLVVDKVVVSWGGVTEPYTLRANLTVRAFTMASLQADRPSTTAAAAATTAPPRPGS